MQIPAVETQDIKIRTITECQKQADAHNLIEKENKTSKYYSCVNIFSPKDKTNAN